MVPLLGPLLMVSHWQWEQMSSPDFARGFRHTASGGEGLLNNETMSVGPQLLVCLPAAGAVVCSITAVGWLMGLTGVGHLIVWVCCASSSADALLS